MEAIAPQVLLGLYICAAICLGVAVLCFIIVYVRYLLRRFTKWLNEL